jgi:putative ABC transport system permease protein
METLRIALRNIRRNERRSRLTIITIVIGTTILMNVQGVFRGLTSTVYSRMMEMETGQVQVEATGYRSEARRLPLDLVVEDSAALAGELRALSGVAAVSERIDLSLEITNGREGTRTIGRGVSPEEARVTSLGTKIVSGSMLEPGRAGLLIGKGMAGKLGLKLGDTAYFTALDRRSVRNLGSAPVTGIFEFGYPLMDDYLVLMDIGQARAFLDLGPVATRLVIRGTDPGDSAALTRRVAAAIAKARPAGPAAHSGPAGPAAQSGPAGPAAHSGPAGTAGHSGLAAYEWKTFAESLVSTIETRLRLLGVIIGTLFLLIAAGIFNTMAMNVQERCREIGTLRAIGIRRSALERIFLAEGLAMGLIGCALAAVPAGGLGIWLGFWGIDISGILPRDLPIPFGTVLRASYSAVDVLRALLAGLLAASLGSIIPARQAARLRITDALASVR